MGKSWEKHTETMKKSWEIELKIMGKLWSAKNHGKYHMKKSWENVTKIMGKHTNTMEKSWENYVVPKSWKISYEKIMEKFSDNHGKTHRNYGKSWETKKSWEIIFHTN